ncbi:circularly permuted type 2 ATP-grasp protein [Gemmobacter serpentinus]|uniref:circularly permuted type 2 ATP-grasp protein n=1 Tax=Gemmobacter serpentinus TaxID=2652247 RepID=UPI00124CE726|nr:circularly permuted type 2 ATP-grasp protein [Gemmobacter serpentinus]
MSHPAASPAPPAILAGYRPQPGVADELFDSDGRMRPVWAPFITQLASLAPHEVATRFARGEQYLRDAGVYFRLYSGGPAQEREWPLSHVPVILSDAEWQGICAGLTQRAELLERVMADLYGPGRLVSDGHLPAELVAQNPQWLRPLVGITPRSGHWLHHLAFEIGRSPDGSFFVLGDRAQAPSGSGFALENRMATTRIFSDPFPRANVRRLAGFFRAFRAAMEDQAGAGRRMAILTPGPNNDTYYEHTYIARYLGMTLLEGEDLIVQNGQAMVRTVRGLEPLGLLWRRIDSEFADPLELNETSQIGTPGLLEALRQGNLSLINALGSGVIEARAMMAFLPRICETLMGAPLQMPNIATWWCGQPRERAYVQQNAAKMMIGAALDAALPFAIGADTALGGQFRAGSSLSLPDWLAAEGGRLVGQEAVTLSTTPAWTGEANSGRLVPRPMTIRVFAARTAQGWTFMPGGYARIGKSDDATALAMQNGGSVADVWVVAPEAVKPDSLVQGNIFERNPPGILPSRAADNLYWLGRYIERTEGAIRLLRAWHLRLAETGDPDEARLQELAAYMERLGLHPDRPIPEGLAGLVSAARNAAAKVRDRFSPDGWGALNDLAKTTAKLTAKVSHGDDAALAMSILLRKISGFSGLVHENMYHFAGWRFLSLGRAEERAGATLMLLETFTDPEAAPGALEIAIEVGDSAMTHQRRYRFGPSRQTVLDLLMLDAQNPRSVLYQVAQLRHHIGKLPQEGAGLSALDRILLRIDTDLRVADPAGIDAEMLADLRARMSDVFELISTSFLR